MELIAEVAKVMKSKGDYGCCWLCEIWTQNSSLDEICRNCFFQILFWGPLYSPEGDEIQQAG